MNILALKSYYNHGISLETMGADIRTMSSWWQGYVDTAEDRNQRLCMTHEQYAHKNTHKQLELSNYTRTLDRKPTFGETNIINIH